MSSDVTSTRHLALLGHLDWLANGGGYFFFSTRALPKRTSLSVIGPLMEGNDVENIRTLNALFDCRTRDSPSLLAHSNHSLL
jgi:hypothetical protein